MKKRTLKLHYILDGEQEWATIETADGFYVCDVYRCCEEGRRRFRYRARSLQQALEYYDRSLVLLGDNA